MNQTFNSRESADKAMAYYIERTERGIRLDTLPWIHDVITVEVEEDNPTKIIW
jgi:hypothetical protein